MGEGGRGCQNKQVGWWVLSAKLNKWEVHISEGGMTANQENYANKENHNSIFQKKEQSSYYPLKRIWTVTLSDKMKVITRICVTFDINQKKKKNDNNHGL